MSNKQFVEDCLKPFAKHEIGQLSKGGAKLDYVGHAQVTKRLLELDPNWSWQPMAYNNGLPAFDEHGGLWIWLTVNGVTRIGYGEQTGGFTPADKVKSAIGDAIRNAAMRFGIALALWAKEEPIVEPVKATRKPSEPSLADVKVQLHHKGATNKAEALKIASEHLETELTDLDGLTPDQIKKLWVKLNDN